MGLWLQRDKSPSLWECMAASGTQGSRNRKLRAHIFNASTKKREQTGSRVRLKLSKPAPSEYLVPQGHTS